ncbi:Regulatory protein RecX [Candidatus Burkholderia humilis]|nr:Regulatory protein RecX [Candidatus Burkholderia humilis]
MPVSHPQSADHAERLERARAVLTQATERVHSPAVDRPTTQPPAATATAASVSPQKPRRTSRRSSDARRSTFSEPTDSFENDTADPFEQCAPSDAQPASSDTVYSRTSQRPRKSSAADLKNSKRRQRSLKGRALCYLSRREHSRAELSRKLQPYVEETDSLDSLLDDLEREGWLSNVRFVESVVHRRAARMDGSRIINELKRHAVGDTLISETAGKLAQTELARAQTVWEKKFDTVPETPAERTKQTRFLAARDFSGGTIGKVLKGEEEDLSDDFIDD